MDDRINNNIVNDIDIDDDDLIELNNIMNQTDDDDDDDDDNDDHDGYFDVSDNENITCSYMNITSYGVLLCSGYSNGEIYVYNISDGEAVLEIHTRLSKVTSLLLLCIDGYKNHDNDGILFIGYQDGFIEIFNCKTGENILSKQCHFGSVTKIIQFEQDYYVFSVGDDNAVCSYLVYSQLVTLKYMMQQLEDDEHDIDTNSDDHVEINYYRGHSCSIRNIYRNEWCLTSDLICIELENNEMFIWCVASAQIERHIINNNMHLLGIDRSFLRCNRRNKLVTNYKHTLFNIYKLNRNSSHINCNVLTLDIISIFKQNKMKKLKVMDLNTKNRNQNQKLSNNNIDPLLSQYTVNQIISVLSLLLDWEIHSGSFYNDFVNQFSRYLFGVDMNQNKIRNRMNNYTANRDDDYNVLLVKDIKPCYGYIGDYDSLTLLFPISSYGGGKWKMQNKLTSIYMLAINTLCIWLKKQIQIQPPININKTPFSPPSSLSKQSSTESDITDNNNNNNNSDLVSPFIQSELIMFYSVMLPTNLTNFIEPSRTTISRSCLSSTPALRKSSRLLLEKFVKRMAPNKKKTILVKWKKKYNINDAISNPMSFSDDDEKKMYKSKNPKSPKSPRTPKSPRSPKSPRTPKGKKSDKLFKRSLTDQGRVSLNTLFDAIIICIIHILQTEETAQNNNNNQMHKPIEISPNVASSIINLLIRILGETIHHKSDCIKKALACYYLGRSITSIWYKYLSESSFESLLRILLDLSSDHDDGGSMYHDNILSESAIYCLIQCGISSAAIFIKTMGTQSLIISSRGRHVRALQCIQKLIYTFPHVLYPSHILYTIQIIIKCLDPSSPQKRKLLLKSTTSTLHSLVNKYPNCSFNSQKQHFAVGTDEGTIIIYNLRTATRLNKVIKNKDNKKDNNSPITCISFNNDGKYIISYQAYQKPNPLLSLFKLNINDGVLGSFFGSQSKCIKVIKLKSFKNIYSQINHLNYTQLIWEETNKNNIKSSVKLTREDQSVQYFDLS